MYKCNPNHKPIRIKVQIWKRVKQTHLSEWDLCLNYFHHNSRCKTFHEKKWLWKWIKHKYNMAGQCGCFVSFGCCFVVVLFFFLSYILPQSIRVSRVCTRYVFQHNESCTFVVLLQRCLLPDVSFYTERMCLWDTLILRQHVTTGIMVTFKYSLFTFTTMVNLYPTMCRIILNRS